MCPAGSLRDETRLPESGEIVFTYPQSVLTRTWAVGAMLRHSGHLNARRTWAPKFLQMVTTAMKLKDARSLEEKL